jgi:hypothetical protein
MIVVAVAILVGVFFVATGRGGELAYEHADHAPLDLGPVSAADVALLRPPTALWGYNMQVTDEALEQIAQAVRDRDVTIAFLQQRLADLATQPGPGLQPGEPPLVHRAQHARSAESGDPASPQRPASLERPASPERPASAARPADLPGQDDHADPRPADDALDADSALAAEEQAR